MGAPGDPSSDYPADLYTSLHCGNEGDEGFYRAVCVGADRVLELGCGSGRILSALADQVTELHGVDSSEEALAIARKKLPASLALERADMETFDVGGGFDRVLIPFNGIYCLPDLASVRRTFVQVEKALAVGGLLVLDGYAGHYRYLSEADGEEILATIRHRYLRLEEALEALESAGLEPLVAHGDFDQRVERSNYKRPFRFASHAT